MGLRSLCHLLVAVETGHDYRVTLGGGVFGLMASVREIAQDLEIVFRQRHEEELTFWPAPAVALNAADEPLAVVVDLNERATAVGALPHASPIAAVVGKFNRGRQKNHN